MADDAPPEIDRRRIRIGLGLITVVVVVSIILLFAVGSPIGKAVMFAIAVTAFYRALRLSRSLGAERAC